MIRKPSKVTFTLGIRSTERTSNTRIPLEDYCPGIEKSLVSDMNSRVQS